MSFSRTLIQDFLTSNKIYSKAVVTFYEVTNNIKTSNLANLYSSVSGSSMLANPQTLDGYGKFRQPVYVDTSVYAEITGFGNAPDHETGIFNPSMIFSGNGSPEGSVSASIGSIYLRLDGGVGTTLYVKESGIGTTGWSAK